MLVKKRCVVKILKPCSPYAERKETGSDQLENEASWALFIHVRNMAARGFVSSRLSQSLRGRCPRNIASGKKSDCS